MKNEEPKSTAVMSPEQMSATLDKYENRIARAAPKGVDPLRMIEIAKNAVRSNPKLLACDPVTLFGSILQVLSAGLSFNPVMQHAHLIPYGNEVKYMIGYQGMIELAYKFGGIKHLDAQAVFKGDEFDHMLGTETWIKHKRTGDGVTLTHAYAFVINTDDYPRIEIMNRKQIEHIRDTSPGGAKSGAWRDYFDEMAKKTVIRRLLKQLPKDNKSAPLEVIEREGETITLDDVTIPDADETEANNGTK